MKKSDGGANPKSLEGVLMMNEDDILGMEKIMEIVSATERTNSLCGCGSFEDARAAASRLNSMNDQDCSVWKTTTAAMAVAEILKKEKNMALSILALGIIFKAIKEAGVHVVDNPFPESSSTSVN